MEKEDDKKWWKSVDKSVLVKAVGIMLLGWVALPVVYWLLIRKEKKENGEDRSADGNSRNSDTG